MLRRKTWIQLVTKLGIGVGALCIVGVLLAAIPNHRVPVTTVISPETQQGTQSADHTNMTGTSMDADDPSAGEQAVKHDRKHKRHGDTPHRHVTAPRPQRTEDQTRAQAPSPARQF